MGLALHVGFLAELRDCGEEEGVNDWQDRFNCVNQALISAKLPEYQEPLDLHPQKYWWCQMHGYSGLHYLRRIAAHLTATGELPLPGDSNASEDSILDDYYSLLHQGEQPNFDHLIFHSDAEGFYVPIQFEEVLYPGIHYSKELPVIGDMIGSSYSLLNECQILAQALQLPQDLDLNKKDLWNATDNQGLGDIHWQRYGIESFTCLRLLHACQKSIGLKAAIVFH